MPARRGALLAAALCLAAVLPAASGLRAAPVQADPHDLYLSAQTALSQGDLQAADAALTRLHALIASGPKWDPEGVFSKELLPPVQARLKRLEAVAGRLDAFNARAPRQLRPPDPLKVTSTVRNYTDWATSVIRTLRAERDAIVADALPTPEERAIASRTAAYAKSEQLLETDLLKGMADAAGDDILGLLAGDPNQESILLRFRQIKLELMQAVEERDRLNREIAKSGERQEALFRALGSVLAEGAPPEVKPDREPSACVVEQFDRFLDAERASLEGRSSLTEAEQERLGADLDRYRRYRQALAPASIVLDPGGKIEALARAAQALPVSGRIAARPAPGGRSLALLAGALLAAAGAFAWLASARRARAAGGGAAASRGPAVSGAAPPARPLSFDDTNPVPAAGPDTADDDDADRNAA